MPRENNYADPPFSHNLLNIKMQIIYSSWEYWGDLSYLKDRIKNGKIEGKRIFREILNCDTTIYEEYKKGKQNGRYFEKRKFGSYVKGNFYNGVPSGEWEYYFNSKKLKILEKYKNGKCLSRRCYNEKGKKIKCNKKELKYLKY